jgi:biopolymer transport protein ExbD
MILEEKKYGWCQGLRIRYRPRTLVGRGMIGAAPWIDVVLIVVFVLLLATKTVLQPGAAVALPVSDAPVGTQHGVILIVLSHESPSGGERKEVAFFGDEPYDVIDDDDMKNLRRSLGALAREKPNTPLVIEADVSVRHGTIMNLCNMARAAHVQTVNLATRLTEGGSNEQ